MFEKYKYDYYFKSIYEIPFAFYEEHHVKALFVDLDNTLVEDENRLRPTHFDKWYAEVTNHGIDLFVVSNNVHEERLREFMEGLPIQWYHHAKKQNGKLFRSLMKQQHLRAEEIAVIGDRIGTDIVGGNKIGALTILTQPLVEDKNVFTRFLMRPLENVLFLKSHKDVK